MNYNLYPNHKTSHCLVIVGGLGDKGEDYGELVKLLQSKLPNLTFCTFTLSQSAKKYDELLAIQTNELELVIEDLIHKQGFKVITIYTSSMGAFATTWLIVNSKYSKNIDKVLYFDPADYFLEGNISKPSGSITWAGYEKFAPDKPTISTTLSNLKSGLKIEVVHFIVKNYGPSGYCCENLTERGISHEGYYSRLNTDMVKSFHLNVPIENRGHYIEIDNLPHGYFRDGYLDKNLIILDQSIRKLLLSK